MSQRSASSVSISASPKDPASPGRCSRRPAGSGRAILPATMPASAPARRSASASAPMSSLAARPMPCAAAAQRAGPDRAERRRPDCDIRTAAVRPSARRSLSSPSSRLSRCRRDERARASGPFYVGQRRRCLCHRQPRPFEGASFLTASRFFMPEILIMRRLIRPCRCRPRLVASVATADAQQAKVQIGVLECTRRRQRRLHRRLGDQSGLHAARRQPRRRPYVANIRKVGLRCRHHRGAGCWPGACSRRRPARRRATLPATMPAPGKRVARRRCRRQRAGRRPRQFDRAAAAERAGPGRHRYRLRLREPGTAAGPLLTTS